MLYNGNIIKYLSKTESVRALILISYRLIGLVSSFCFRRRWRDFVKKNMFELPEIETNATKKAVEEALERYRMLLLQTPEESIPKLTATYSFIPPSTNKEYISTTEAMAVQKADFEAMREKYLTKIQKAVNRLKPRERALIVNKYMLQEDKYDYEVYNSIGLSERTYYRYKARAFYSLALSLGIEVYKEDVQTA